MRMSKPVTAVYRTTNWRAYKAALKQRGSLLVWFDPEMEWLAAPSGRRGRPATFSDAAIQACLRFCQRKPLGSAPIVLPCSSLGTGSEFLGRKPR